MKTFRIIAWTAILLTGLCVPSHGEPTPKEQMEKVVTLIAEDKLPQARRTVDALLVLYPDDARLLKFKEQLVATAERKSAADMKPITMGAVVPGKTFTVGDGLNLTMIWIEPGTFSMENEHGILDSGGGSDEKPVTRVTLSRGFWLGMTEVTQAQWKTVGYVRGFSIRDGGRDLDAAEIAQRRAFVAKRPAYFEGDDRPIENVSWDDCIAFCRELTKRERLAGRLPDGYAYTLPTEAQWEYACRAGTTEDYAGDPKLMGWYAENSNGETHAVAQKQPNAWGIHDMHGNVWEWCLDWYGNYLGGTATDPTGPESGMYRIVRGGTWAYPMSLCGSSVRITQVPDRRIG